MVSDGHGLQSKVGIALGELVQKQFNHLTSSSDEAYSPLFEALFPGLNLGTKSFDCSE